MRKRAAKIGTINYAPRKFVGRDTRRHATIQFASQNASSAWRDMARARGTARRGRNNSFSRLRIIHRSRARPVGEISFARAGAFLISQSNDVAERRRSGWESRRRVTASVSSLFLSLSESSAPAIFKICKRIASSPDEDAPARLRSEIAIAPPSLPRISPRWPRVGRFARGTAAEISVRTAGRPPRRLKRDAMGEREARIMASVSRVCLRGGGGVVYPRCREAAPIISASNGATTTRRALKNPSRPCRIIRHAHAARSRALTAQINSIHSAVAVPESRAS